MERINLNPALVTRDGIGVGRPAARPDNLHDDAVTEMHANPVINRNARRQMSVCHLKFESLSSFGLVTEMGAGTACQQAKSGVKVVTILGSTQKQFGKPANGTGTYTAKDEATLRRCHNRISDTGVAPMRQHRCGGAATYIKNVEISQKGICRGSVGIKRQNLRSGTITKACVKGVNANRVVIAGMTDIADLKPAPRASQIKETVFENGILRPTILGVGETAAANRENLHWLCHTLTFSQQIVSDWPKETANISMRPTLLTDRIVCAEFSG
jgi:hypothetical protein